jgi:6-phosphogluconolactonase
MTEPNVLTFPDLESLSRAAADEFCQIAVDAVAQRGRCVVALAGGHTPRRIYEMLGSPSYRSRVPWQQIDVFWSDERMVPPEDPDSNFRMAFETLLSKVPLPNSSIHRVTTENCSPAQAADTYGEEIARTFNIPAAGGLPSFDLILLGMGEDGHTASLFPHSPALQVTDRWAAPSRAPKRPNERVTMTLPVINAARHVMMIIAGTEKARILADVLIGPRGHERLPSQLVAPTTGELLLFVDKAAAFHLTQTGQSGSPRL